MILGARPFTVMPLYVDNLDERHDTKSGLSRIGMGSVVHLFTLPCTSSRLFSALAVLGYRRPGTNDIV